MPTTHAEPTYEVDGVIHYCVANMPGAVPLHLEPGAEQRDFAAWPGACRGGGLMVLPKNSTTVLAPHVHRGCFTHKAVAESFPARSFLATRSGDRRLMSSVQRGIRTIVCSTKPSMNAASVHAAAP